MTTKQQSTRLRNFDGNWIVGTVDGLEVQAKAFTEPSHYGMDLDGRISKLWVRSPGFGVLYNYDRGDVDVDYLNDKGLAMVVEAVGKAIK